MVETALVFPVIFLCVLGFFQLTLLVHAHSAVRGAAFFAARAATVWIPQDTGSEPAESLYFTEGSLKADAILRSARLSLVPISPNLTAVGPGMPGYLVGQGEDHAEEADRAMSELGASFPATAYAARYGYSALATDVEIRNYGASSPVSATEQESLQFDRFEDIEVTVVHEYYLGVPLVDRVFAGFERSSTYAGDPVQPSFYTARIHGTCTLPLETAFEEDEVWP